MFREKIKEENARIRLDAGKGYSINSMGKS